MIVILLGMPIVVVLVKNMRDYKIDLLMTTITEKMNSDIDSLNQITTIHEWLRDSGKTSDLG